MTSLNIECFYSNKLKASIDISIIIPSYCPCISILEKCLESIFNQKETASIHIEIIIVLNGDKEPYLTHIVNVIQSINSLITFQILCFYSHLKGVSNARNVGIKQSSGNYICFIDDDDWISENYISELYSLISKGKYPLATMIDIIDGLEVPSYYGTQFSILKKSKNLKLMNIRSWFSVPVLKMFSKEDIRTHQFNRKLSNGEDGLFVFDVLNSKLNFSLTSEKAVYYRRVRDSGLVGKLKNKHVLKRLLHATHLSFLYFTHYFKNGCKYSFLFLGTRILAPFKHIIK